MSEQISPLFEIHQAVAQANQLELIFHGEAGRQKINLEKEIKNLLMDLRSFSLSITWYPKLSESGIHYFIKSPIFNQSKRKISDSPTALPFPSTITTKLNLFLKSYQEHMDLILQCAAYYFLNNSETFSWIPCDSPGTFFAASTFPGLFGYGWCIEQNSIYIQAICSLIKFQLQICSVKTSDFQNSICRDVLRQFIHMSGIQTYLQHALSSYYFFFSSDSNFANLSEEQLGHQLFLIAENFTQGLIDSIPLLPNQVKILFKEVSKIKLPTCLERSLVDFLFFEIILQPALLNPKLFGLIPDTSTDSRGSFISELTRNWKKAFSHLPLPQAYAEFSKLRSDELISRILLGDSPYDGLSSEALQKVSDTSYHYLLFSLNDYILLATVITESISYVSAPEAQKEKLLKLFPDISNIAFKNDTLYDFWYQSFKLPTRVLFTPYSNNLELPIFEEPEENIKDKDRSNPFMAICNKQKNISNKGSNRSLNQPASTIIHSESMGRVVSVFTDFEDKINNIGSILVTQLPKQQNEDSLLLKQSVRPRKNSLHSSKAPIIKEETPGEILSSHAIKMLTKIFPHQNEPDNFIDLFLTSETDIANGMVEKINKTGIPENEIFNEIEKTVNQKVLSMKRVISGSYLVRSALTDVHRQVERINQHRKELRPIFHQAFLRYFFVRTKWVSAMALEGQEQILSDDDFWIDFFKKATKALAQFSKEWEIEESDFISIVRQMHSHFLHNISYSTFCKIQSEKLGGIITIDYAEKLNSFKKQQFSPIISHLIEKPDCFDGAVKIIQNGLRIGAPLERLGKLIECIHVLQAIYGFEKGCSLDTLDETDFINLVVFTLLNAQLPDIFFIKQLFFHFIQTIDSSEPILRQEDRFVIAIFFLAINTMTN